MYARATTVSRQLKNKPHVMFMAKIADSMEVHLGKADFDVVADLTNVLYDKTVDAEDARKAKKRHAQTVETQREWWKDFRSKKQGRIKLAENSTSKNKQ
jgi:hypothetical protein